MGASELNIVVSKDTRSLKPGEVIDIGAISSFESRRGGRWQTFVIPDNLVGEMILGEQLVRYSRGRRWCFGIDYSNNLIVIPHSYDVTRALRDVQMPGFPISPKPEDVPIGDYRRIISRRVVEEYRNAIE